MHWPDPKTPLEETLGAMEEVQRAGKTRLVGVSNFDVALLEQARQVRPIDVLQVGYNLFDRRMEREVFPYCREHGIGVMAYGSLAYGLLTGGFTPETTFEPADWRSNGIAFGQPILRGDNFKHNVRLVDRLRDEVARPRDLSVARVALAWVLRNPSVTTAMVGARVPAEIEDNVGAAAISLSDAEAVQIESLMAEAAGRVEAFRPFGSAMDPRSGPVPCRGPPRSPTRTALPGPGGGSTRATTCSPRRARRWSPCNPGSPNAIRTRSVAGRSSFVRATGTATTRTFRGTG